MKCICIALLHIEFIPFFINKNVFLGTTEKDKTTLKNMVSSLSGSISSKLDSSVSAVISSKSDVDKMGKKMKEIKELNIPVVSEGMGKVFKLL